ncbi:3-hydroxyanthranilate 3,4-dioxygenase [Antarcticibacterium arcticum]|uniref:3-hydroxyanthranilate 3,4-dioxygenase n=1 Tax=Antarcticibacterium arcticum TaxID=2585771 RepID=A0A5B8YQU7_9FLAO|nr:3-hydroxyanthranilate 3,4-dioxygenase [Antarcticibacterium arcticum]QED38369.1 3-hydroxyanthranilate 3,4-dioxygenase [Antarcticibacterium arcticum]
MPIDKPFNLNKWIEQNRDLLKPPVGNKNIYRESNDYIVMVVGGPNARKDYHYNETEELFYQLEGNIKVHIQENGLKRTMELGPGDMYLHPGKVPHSPEREEGSIGIVIERKRVGLEGMDGLLWYCDNCNNKLYEVFFPLDNIETDFLAHFKKFYQSEELRTCQNCGTVMPADPKFIAEVQND